MTRIGWVALALAGCSGSVSGTVDGEPVRGSRDAIFDQVGVDFPFLGRLEVTFVMVTDFADACDVLDGFLTPNALTCDDRCEEYLTLASDHGLVAGEAWGLAFFVNTSDEDEVIYEVDGAFGAGSFTSRFERWNTGALSDPATCEAACEAGELLLGEAENAQSGTLEITSSDEQSIEGIFDLELGGADQISGSFDASPCDVAGWSIID